MQPHATTFYFGPGHRLGIAGLALSICIAAGSESEAAVFTCSGGDVPCLVAAINAANANGQVNTIRLGEGIYTLTAVDNSMDGPNGLPSVTSTLTIVGVGDTATTVERVADASSPFRILHVGPEGVLTLRRLTISGGKLDTGSGAGVLANGSVSITDSVITGNRFRGGFGQGGGVAGGDVTLTRTTISNNLGDGAGVFVTANRNLSVWNSTIADNSGQKAGGIWFHSAGALTVRETTITGNQSGKLCESGGVVIDVDSSAATIRNSTISDNFSECGAGIWVSSNSVIDIEHSAIVHNTAFRSSGGGIVANGGTMTIRESTIAGNGSNEVGAGLLVGSTATVTVTASTIVGNVVNYRGVAAGITGSARLENTILSHNVVQTLSGPAVESNCSVPLTSLGHNLISDPTRCGDLQPTDLVGDPGLGDFIDPGRAGTAHYPLLAGSLAIDTGSAEACRGRDQQGLVRAIDGDGDDVRGCDIGATEFYPVVNEWVQLERVHATFVPPNATETLVNPLAAGGTYRIDAAFTNNGGQNICHLAFEVITLDATSGVASVLTRNGNLIGREGIQFPATLAGERVNLRAGGQERYRFTIGVTEAAPITFFVNMLGERTAGRCALGPVSAGDAGAVDPDRD